MQTFKTTMSLKRASFGLITSAMLAGCTATEQPASSSAAAMSSAVAVVSSSAPAASSVAPIPSSSSVMSSSSVAAASSSAPDPTANMPLVVAINSGGEQVTFEGVSYIADKYYLAGGTANTTADPISGVTDDAMYQTERYGSFKYEIPVTAATNYTIELHFAEIYQEAAGLRSFSVAVEGNTELNNIDLYSLAGHDGAYSYVVEGVQVSDGLVTIELVAGTQDNPTIAGLAVYSRNGQLDLAYEPPTPTIPDFTGEKFVGNITTGGGVRSDFMKYWNQITPENEGKWGSVEGTRDQYNWAPVDRVYEFARANGIPVKAHTFVWGSQAPSWINDASLSAADIRAEIEEWMRDYCARYPDTAIIDVVNEAVEGHAPAGYAQKAFGNDWIVESFKLARQHCPNAILVYNDFNFLTWNTEEILATIRSVLDYRDANGKRVIDALGLQAHSWTTPKIWTSAEIKEKLDYIHQQSGNLPLYISEYDIEDSSQGSGDAFQLRIFQDQFPAFYEHPAVVGVTLWGYVVGQTWRDGTGLIQSNGQHRPAMDWLMEYLGRN